MSQVIPVSKERLSSVDLTGLEDPSGLACRKHNVC